MFRSGISVAILFGSCLALWHRAVADETPPAAQLNPADVEFFEAKIRPLLAARCYECHSAQAKQVKGGLRLDTRAAVLRGGESGPALVSGNSDESLLIKAIRHAADVSPMPPQGKLPDAAIQDLVEWVRRGAPDPRTADVSAAIEKVDFETARRFWSFQRPTRHEAPAVQNAAWPRGAIDAFVLARLEAAGLTPAGDADRRVLIRRLSFDLVGLPPTLAEVEEFVADSGPAAVERVVDRLLAAPQFGERWGRHWLDVARYSDTKGYVFEEDRNYPQAFMYRDWVVQSLNDDLPYDQFLLRQLAADQLPVSGDPRQLAAMGFLTLGRRFTNNIHDIIDDRIDVVMRGTQGLTVTCARCHDHKYDPIPTADYYSLYSVFQNSREPKDAPSPLRLIDVEKPQGTRIFVRGNSSNQGDEVPRRFLHVLAGDARQPFQIGSGRLELAHAIASPDNPLTARVLVNRVWAHLFGAGLVLTPSDFGLRSDAPSHPDLLDDLARRFVEDGWSMKRLVRSIVLSRVYQQSSDHRPACAAVDSENRLLWRANRRRLDLEALRDALLAASGTLDRTIGGPAVKLTEAPFPRRRTLYGFIDRQNLPGIYRTFDFASPDTHSPQRYQTTVPQQALFLLNSPFLLELAVATAARSEVAAAPDDAHRVRLLYQAIHARMPDEQEMALATRFLSAPATGLSPVAQLAQVLMLSNEFSFVD